LNVPHEMKNAVKGLRRLGWALLLATPAGAAPQVKADLHFASNEWPPFVTSTLPANGLAGSLLSSAYERMGMTAHIGYFPWKRAMELGLHDPRYAGFLAVWRTTEREKVCHFSSSIGNTVTVLAYLKEAPVQPAALADLQGVRIGTVAGYANGDQFDTMAAAGQLQTEEAYSDELNVRKLLNKRFPAMVIEKRVLRHLLASDRFTRDERERIGFVEGLFRERSIHVCFKRTAQGLAQQRAFNDAMRDIDLQKAERDYWRRIGVELARTQGGAMHP
jgi:polar amino acid transport system substrate-binding protein